MATEAELQARILELEKKVEALSVIAGRAGGSLDKVRLGADGLLGPFAELFNATKSGATGLSAYNSTLNLADKEFEKISSLLGSFGGGLSVATTASKQFIQAVNVQTDELYKSYQGLSAAGAAGRADLPSIMETAKQFGVTNAQELPKFNQLIASNSEELARFGGTVAQGVKQFGDLAAGIQQTGIQTEFMNLGMTVDSINKGMAGYLKIQNLTGSAQKMTTDQLTAGAAGYIRELDLLTKLTGKSAEAQMKEQEDRLNDERYAIHYRDLKRKSDAGDIQATEQLRQENLALQQTTGDVKKGLMAAYTGFGLQTEVGLKFFQAAPEAFNMAAKGLGTNANKILDTAQKEVSRTMDIYGPLYMAAGNDLTSSVVDMMKLEGLKGTAEEREAEALRQRKTQTENTEASVQAMTSLTQMQRQATTDLTDMLNKGVVPVTIMMENLAIGVRTFADTLPGAEKRSLRQETEQGAGRAVEGGPGSRIGRPEYMPPVGPGGKPFDEVMQEGRDQAGALANLIQEAQNKLQAQADAATGSLKDMLLERIKALKNWNSNIEPPPAVSTDRPVIPPAVTGNISTLSPSQIFSANISQGIINVASADNIRFPTIRTGYSSKINATGTDLQTTEEIAKAFENFNADNVPNSAVIASNTVLAGKMDDLIEIMRGSKGYLENISMKTYT